MRNREDREPPDSPAKGAYWITTHTSTHCYQKRLRRFIQSPLQPQLIHWIEVLAMGHASPSGEHSMNFNLLGKQQKPGTFRKQQTSSQSQAHHQGPAGERQHPHQLNASIDKPYRIGGINNQRATATTITLTAAVIASLCNSTGRVRRRQRNTV